MMGVFRQLLGLEKKSIEQPTTATAQQVRADIEADSRRAGEVVTVTTRDGNMLTLRTRTGRATMQQKSRQPVQFELMDTARNTTRACLEPRGGRLTDYMCLSRSDYVAHMRMRQYPRLTHE